MLNSVVGNSVVLESGDAEHIKNFSDTYLYGKSDYEKVLFAFIMTADRVDKADKSFEDLRFDIKKRQVTNSLVKVLDSDQTVLCMSDTPLPKAYKVMVAKDVRGDKKLKVFIDVSIIIKKENGRYTYRAQDLDILVSYLLSALNTKIYFTLPTKVLGRSAMIDAGAYCFSAMTFYILDYLRICSSTPNAKAKIYYVSTIYYLSCHLMKDPKAETTINRAKKISKITDREIEMMDIKLDKINNPYKNISTFCEVISAVLGTTITVDTFIDKWMWLFGVGTQYGTEFYPAFASMLTNAYVGAMINNQKTIEKVCGPDMVEFTNELFKVGGELLK